jgi:glucokinase
MILAGDIGGTNTRLALFEMKGGQPQPHRRPNPRWPLRRDQSALDRG